MKRKRILVGLLMSYIVCGVISGEDSMKTKIEAAEKEYASAEEYCSMEDLGAMDYYLFCDTQLRKGASGYEGKPSIINNDTQTIEEAKELYQKFRGQLPLEEENRGNADGEEERTEVSYVSPDCKWVVTQKWGENQVMMTQTIYYEKTKVREQVSDTTYGVYPLLIVKNGDVYKEMEEEGYKRLTGYRKEIGYIGEKQMNAEGNLYAVPNYEDSRIIIGAIKDWTEQWSFDLHGIREEAKKIRENRGYGENSLRVYIEQLEGNEQEGWLVVQVGRSSFFRIAYPSGEVTYLGEYLYSPCFSPDGKYLAYSSVDYDNGVGMKPEEEKQTPPPGIYVKEVETGKTAYIYWYPSIETGEDFLDYRTFTWIEKEGFEEYMGM